MTSYKKMNIKSIFIWFVRLVFSICLLVSIITVISRYSINERYFYEFWITYIVSFIIAILTFKKNFRYIVMLIGIMPIIILSYRSFKEDRAIEFRQSIANSNYSVIMGRNNYKLVEKKYIFERIVAQKKSNIFSSNQTKTGIIQPFFIDCKILQDSTKNIILEIKAKLRTSIDTLEKLD